MTAARIVLLVISPFSRRDYERFGVEVLRRWFRVSILDCTAWLKPEFAAKYADVVYSCPGYVPIESAESLWREIDRDTPTVVIDYLGSPGASEVRAFRRQLRSRGVPRAAVQAGLLPEPPATLAARGTGRIRLSDIVALGGKVWRRALRALRPEPTPEIVVLSGTAGLRRNGAHRSPRKIWAHSADFDTYVAVDRERQSVPPYAVFLDEDMIYHSDFEHAGSSSPATESAYYGSLNRLFEEIEAAYGTSVVVAAHPRSRYDIRPHLWSGRRVVHGRTAELVRDSALVICHQSTAISFAVLWRKPLLFLTTREIAVSGTMHARIGLISSMLNAVMVNVDARNGVPPWDILSSVDEAAYTAYVREYIKRDGAPAGSLWEIFSLYVEREIAPGGAGIQNPRMVR